MMFLNSAAMFSPRSVVMRSPSAYTGATGSSPLPGSGEAPVAPVYVDGERVTTLRGEHIAAEFKAIVDDYVARKYPPRTHND